MTPDGMDWIKAARSYGGGACVEVAPVDGGVAVRDSKDPDGPVLLYSIEEFAVFLAAARNGEFDHLVRVCHRTGTRQPEETT